VVFTACTRADRSAPLPPQPASASVPNSGDEDHSALSLTLLPLRPLLDDPELTELCINRPGEAYIERASGWERTALPYASFEWCLRLAKLIANAAHQKIDAQSPLLSATLPSGERAQVVIPPATTSGTVAVTLRRPADRVLTLDELRDKGVFAHTQVTTDRILLPDPVEDELTDLLRAHAYTEFLRLAVRSRKNILISGPTGSGKTTCSKALILEIPPTERLITIEDARELVLDDHPNHVRLFYSKNAQGQSRVSPRQLLQSCLRMRPDRILLAELRGEEAFEYLRNVNSGHPGSITSIHASSCDIAFEQLALLIKESGAGHGLERLDLLTLVHQAVDVVIQVGIQDHKRCMREIRYRGRQSSVTWPDTRSPTRGAARLGH
jgi:type IV secretion system protein VirB11